MRCYMDTKICGRCKKTLSTESFSKNKTRKDGLESRCRECRKEIYNEKRDDNIKKSRMRYAENREILLNKKKKEYIDKKEEILKRNSSYANKNKESIAKRMKKYQEMNKEILSEKGKEYRKKNKEKIIEKSKVYAATHKEQIRAYTNNYVKKRMESDACFKLRRATSGRIRQALKHGDKTKTTKELIGCDVEYLKEHLEKQFKDGMNWENHGTHGWHIDHIRPCASFDLSDEQQQRECFHYSNMQPLWADENIKKSDKWDGKINNEENLYG